MLSLGIIPSVCHVLASLTQWTWIWANSRRQWRTEETGEVQSMGLQRVGDSLATGQQQQTLLILTITLWLFVTSQVRKWRYWKVKEFAQGHILIIGRARVFFLSSLIPHLMYVNTMLVLIMLSRRWALRSTLTMIWKPLKLVDISWGLIMNLASSKRLTFSSSGGRCLKKHYLLKYSWLSVLVSDIQHSDSIFL